MPVSPAARRLVQVLVPCHIVEHDETKGGQQLAQKTVVKVMQYSRGTNLRFLLGLSSIDM
jgi:hypothetical protein